MHLLNSAEKQVLWLTLIGGGLLRSRSFLHNIVSYTVNDTLQAYLGLHPNRFWRLCFDGIRLGLGSLTRPGQLVPIFGRIQFQPKAGSWKK